MNSVNGMNGMNIGCVCRVNARSKKTLSFTLFTPLYDARARWVDAGLISIEKIAAGPRPIIAAPGGQVGKADGAARIPEEQWQTVLRYSFPWTTHERTGTPNSPAIEPC